MRRASLAGRCQLILPDWPWCRGDKLRNGLDRNAWIHLHDSMTRGTRSMLATGPVSRQPLVESRVDVVARKPWSGNHLSVSLAAASVAGWGRSCAEISCVLVG